MGFEKEKIKQIKNLILMVAVLILLLLYSKTVLQGIAMLFGIMKPFLYGGVIAFVLNVPLRGIEEKILGNWKGKTAEKWKRPAGIVLTLLFVCALITILIVTVVPQITETVIEIGNKLPPFFEKTMGELESMSKDYPQIQHYIEELETSSLNWDAILNNVVNFARSGMTSMLNSTVSLAGSIVGGIVNFFVAFIFAIYILGQKETLQNQATRILTAYASPKMTGHTMKVCSMLYRNFSNFISGQCLEAVILGTMFVIAMTIFRMPYAILVGVLIAFTALIPIVGAFIGCIVGAFLICVDTPQKAVWFVILFLILQQIEGNLIYPKVVGSSVGLPPIWVLMAVSVGGSLFGVAGMLFFIPLVSTFYMLLRDSVNERNRIKQQDKIEDIAEKNSRKK